MSDDLETVCPSGRVMARRRSLTDQARREEIREEEGRGSLAALSFRLRRRGRWRQLEKKNPQVPWQQLLGVALMERRKLSQSQPPTPARRVQSAERLN